MREQADKGSHVGVKYQQLFAFYIYECKCEVFIRRGSHKNDWVVEGQPKTVA